MPAILCDLSAKISLLPSRNRPNGLISETGSLLTAPSPASPFSLALSKVAARREVREYNEAASGS